MKTGTNILRDRVASSNPLLRFASFISFKIGFILYLFLLLPLALSGQTTSTLTSPPQVPAPRKTPIVITMIEGNMVENQDEEPPYDVTFRFEYHPPLSVLEAIKLTNRLRQMLAPEDPHFVDLRREKAIEVLDLISDYIKMIDDRHSLLPYYTWYEIGEKRVSLGGVDEDSYDVNPAMKNVSAVSFVALRGDVFIHYIKVIDEEGNETRFKVNRWIRLHWPRKDVCFLYFPTDLTKIVIAYSAREDSTVNPKLVVYAGVTTVPEHGKASLYYLTRARQILSNNGEFSSARDDLHKAIESLLRFKNSRQL